MRSRRGRCPAIRLLTLAFLASSFLNRVEASPFQEQLAPLCERIADTLRQDKRGVVTVGRFVGPEESAAEAGPGIAKALMDALARHNITTVAKSDVLLAGRYTPCYGPGGKPEGVRVTVEMKVNGQPSRRFEGNVLFITEQPTAEVDGARALAPLLGLTAVMPPEENLEQRLEKCQDGSVKPRAFLDETRVKAAPISPFALEIFVGDDSRTPKLHGGRAYVELKRGDCYLIRLTNQSEQPAAVTLTIDGLDLFEFSEQKGYRFVIVPARQSAVIRGWHRTNKHSDAFEVVGYAKSAAAQLLPQAPKVGSITATFALCWPRNSRPPEEERSARLAVSRGEKLGTARGRAVESDFEEVEMHLGAVRAAITVRYARPEP